MRSSSANNDTIEPNEAEAVAILRRYWRHPGFRTGQWEIIRAALRSRDVLAILPTGGGKSICYQVPALLKDGFTVVVSPLIALMQDQVAGLNARGIKAAFINSTLSEREIEQRWTNAEFGQYRLLYVAPERLQTDLFLARSRRLKVSLLAVDEAHCISEWGHNFRPAYREIGKARATLDNPPILAVTATATPEVRSDIISQLDLQDPETVVRGFDRPNLIWAIYHLENKRAKVREILSKVGGDGIVYAATRKHVEHWSAWLQKIGVSAEGYHGGLDSDVRERRQERWLSGRTRVIVATNAFGMGIDKPDVRFVIHVDIPGTLEAYYQEAGRAGRDGNKSYAVLLFQPNDEAIQRHLIRDSHPDARSMQTVYNAICNLAQIPVGYQPDTPVTVDLARVAALCQISPPRAQTSAEMLERNGYWQAHPNRENHGLVRFLEKPASVRNLADQGEENRFGSFILDLLRHTPAEAFAGWVEISVDGLARHVGLSESRLLRGLNYLDQARIISWILPGNQLRLSFLQPRSRSVSIDASSLGIARRRADKKLDAMLSYARSLSCRRQLLLNYFGEQHGERCGKCDICLGRHKPRVITPKDRPLLRHIMKQIQADIPRNKWFEESIPVYRIDALVEWLLAEGYLEITNPLSGTFALTPKAEKHLK